MKQFHGFLFPRNGRYFFMKNLMTRKIVFGVLMACVLALGVQGIADALSFQTRTSGDLVTVSRNQEFTITFYPQPKSPVAEFSGTTRGSRSAFERADVTATDTLSGFTQDTSAATGLTVENAGDYYYYDRVTTPATPGGARATTTRTWLSESAAYYYNDEAVTISSDITLTRNGMTIPVDGSTNALLDRHADSHRRLASSITLKGSHGTAGAHVITIRDSTLPADFPTDAQPGIPRNSVTFTIYVVLDRAATPTTPTLAVVSGTNYQADGNDFTDQIIDPADTSAPTNYRIEYEIVEGPGRLYVQIDGTPIRKTSAVRTLSTSNAAAVRLDMNGGTNKVKATAAGAAPTTGIFIFGYPNVAIVSGNNQEGGFGGRLDDPLIVKVTDGKGRAISGLAATFDIGTGTGGMFIPVPGTTVYIDSAGVLLSTITTADPETQVATSTRPAPAADIIVQTDSRGEARTYFQLGTTTAETSQTVTVTAGGAGLIVPPNFRFTGESGTRRPTLSIFSGNNQTTDENGDIEDPLVVVVRMGGNLKPSERVEFRTVKGTLSGRNDDNSASLDAKRVYGWTDGSGQAEVEYFQDPGSGRDTVTATISGDNYEREVTFGINGGRSSGQQQQQQQQQQQTTTPTISLSPTTLTGSPGTSQQLIVTVRDANGNPAAGTGVTFTRSSGFAQVPVIIGASGAAQTTVVIPSSDDVITATAIVGGTTVTQSIRISVTGATTQEEEEEEEEEEVFEPASIEVYDGDDQDGELNRRLDEDLVVEVLDRNNRGVSFEIIGLRVVEGSGRFSPTRPRTDRNGRATFSFTPRSAGSQGVIEIEASVGDLTPAIFTVNVGEPPAAIVRVSGNNQSGRPGEQLANPFVVEVVDANDDPVSGTTVTFAVTAGGGTLSATSATTNNGGRAQTTLTLGDEVGDNTVQARVTGLRAATFTASAGATVLVESDKRAPMYWVGQQKGTLHRLVDSEVEDLAPAVTGVTSIAVDSTNNLLYFAVQTGNNKGAIQRSRLNGRNVQTLKALTAAPIGIAVDAAGSTVYWTNSRGRIQSIAAEGSAKLTNLLSNLANPTAIALSNGHVYWGEPLGRIRRANLTSDPIRPENIATGLGEPLSIAIAKGKVYWIERNGGGGSLQRANLDGSGIQQIKTFASGVPSSLAIDASDNKIYWTRSTGKIQRSNLGGKFTTDIVAGLMGPGSIALGTAAADETPVVRQTPTTPRTPTTPTTPTTYSKYDINRDGAVNNRDTKLVAGAFGQSGAAITNPRTDVDGSGEVDATDLILVIANLDDDVAAPAIDIDLKAMDLDFDRVQEQVEMLLSSGDRSHAAQRGLLYLQHLLANARPDATVLLVNYPNPFNPETWIPYHLASSTDVKIRIYDARGTLVRELTLGHQSAGYYTSRSRAAYWDGQNAFGERVASGIYFYQLQADELSPLRKMVILK